MYKHFLQIWLGEIFVQSFSIFFNSQHTKKDAKIVKAHHNFKDRLYH
jgi:hypothetical protein